MARSPVHDDRLEGDVKVDRRVHLEEPKMYRVTLLNDHYSTMDFVVEVLMEVFRKSETEATRIMLEVHRKGAGVCGVYTRDIASTKVSQVHQLAKQREFPLRASMEEA